MSYETLIDMVCWTIVPFPESTHLFGRQDWDSPWWFSEPLCQVDLDHEVPNWVTTVAGQTYKLSGPPCSLDLDGIAALCDAMDRQGLTVREKNEVLVGVGAVPLFAE